jgi:hypothetical protein
VERALRSVGGVCQRLGRAARTACGGIEGAVQTAARGIHQLMSGGLHAIAEVLGMLLRQGR